MHDLFGPRSGEAFDAVLQLCQLVVRAHSRDKISPVVTELLVALRDAPDGGISEVGSDPSGPGRLEDMRTPNEAGQVVGCTGRRVRQLCAEGLVAHRKIGTGRYLVDVDDLHRHLRGAA